MASTATDLNQQTTTNSGPLYEYVPNQPVTLANFLDVYTSTVVPPDGSGKNPLWTSRTYSYSFCASSTTATVPCLETDSVREFDGINLLVTRQFYDRDGRLVETRTQGPTASLDTVQLTLYDDVNDKTFTSLPCQVTAYTSGRQPIVGFAYYAPTANGSGDDGAYVDPNSAGTACAAGTVFGTNTYSDALGRTVASDDPMGTGAGCLLFGATLHHTSCAQYAAVVANSVPGLPSGDNAPYLQTINVDGNLHQTASYADALGRQAYGEQFTGWGQTPGSGITPYALTAYGYDALGHLVKSTDPGGNQTTYTYDALGRLTASSDPDRGVWHYTYDMDGNLIKSLGPRSAGADTFYAGYDGLDRQVWRNTSNSPTGAYVSYTYDGTAPCTSAMNAIGRVCQQSFAGVSGSGLAGSYTDTYDQRGQVTQQVTTVNGSPYTTKLAYWPGGQIQNTTYPDGETVTPDYNAVGVVTGLSTKQNGVTTTLASNLTYGDNSSGAGATFGDGGQLVGMTLGGVYTTSYSYDDDTRLTDMQLTRTSDHTLFFESSRAYDAVGNVATLWSRVPQGTDTQAFCYDEQNRLTWAGSAGTPPSGCTSGTAPASTLPGGGYFQGYSYDNLDRLNLGDLGVYAYGSSGHIHAPTSITYGSAAYTATYDPAGNMVCRAPTIATTCAGPSPTGAQLQYDAEERLASWQNAPSNPTTTANYLYDGSGERVVQSVTSGGTTTTTAYLGGNEEVATSGSGTTTTTYYAVAGRLIALAVNGTFSYLADDGLGSVSVAFDADGNATASALYRPYGTPRYTSGSMPGSFGFTGQRNDTAVTGLDYDHARYYDPAAAVFATADSLILDAKAVSEGQARMLLNRYAYVEGNPEGRMDPSGHSQCGDDTGACATHLGQAPTCVQFSDHCWTLDQALRERVVFQQAFMNAYGSDGQGGTWGQGEIAFTTWIFSSGRGRSAYWNGVDGMLVSNMYDAAFTWQGGTTAAAQTPVVQNWLAFIAHPGMQTFWTAHNTSIFSATDSAQGQAWLHEESPAEQHFIFDALTLLEAAGTTEVNLGNPASPSPAFPYPTAACIVCVTGPLIRSAAQHVAGQAASICNPDTNCIQIVTTLYPQQYPVTWDYFQTWQGILVDTATYGWLIGRVNA